MKWIAPTCCVLAALVSLASAADDGKPISCDRNFLGEDYKLHWEISGDKEDITFRVTAKTKGWIGLGINKADAPVMRNADLWIFGMHNNAPYAGDFHGNDAEDNTVTEDEGTRARVDFVVKSTNAETTDHTTLTITRKVKVNTNDNGDLDTNGNRNIRNEDIQLLIVVGPANDYNNNNPDDGHPAHEAAKQVATKLNLFTCTGTGGSGGEEEEDDDDAASSVLPFTAMIALLSAALLLVAQRY